MSLPTKKLLLWDIDGTLVHTGQAGEIAMGNALKHHFGVDGSIHDVDYRGRTDRLICRLLLEHHGIEPSAEKIHQFVEGYLEELAAELPQRQGAVLPGILDLLEACSQREDCINALLTGNMSRGAELKLSHYDVWHYFEWGAFADDSPERDLLGPVALQRATEKLGVSVDPQHVWVIGDTPHDIACGRAIGACTVAVATGGYSLIELRAHQPDYLFPDFSDHAPFLQLLE
ncbi:MAG: HAD family hydrolase [Candidatus Methylacidiphilales bacterium]